MAEPLVVDILGLDELVHQFDRATDVIQRESHDAMEKATVVVHRRAGDYPPPPPASSYRRTGTLGRAFTHQVESMAGGVRGIVANPIDYAPEVRGADQAPVHRGRWLTMEDIVNRHREEIDGFFRDAIESLAEFLAD